MEDIEDYNAYHYKEYSEPYNQKITPSKSKNGGKRLGKTFNIRE
jgi:hypothetical protein